MNTATFRCDLCTLVLPLDQRAPEGNECHDCYQSWHTTPAEKPANDEKNETKRQVATTHKRGPQTLL